MPAISPVDASLLATEHPEEPSHSGLLMFLAPGGDGPLTYQAVRDLVERRLRFVPLGRSVMSAPLGGLVRPSWVPARHFDLDDHVRRQMVPEERWAGALANIVAALHSTMLPRDRPLWELHVINGLPEDHVAVYAKTHLALFDEDTGAQLVTALLDDSADTGAPELLDEPAAEPSRSPFEIVGHVVGTAPDQIRRAVGFPQRVAGRAWGTLRQQLPGLVHAATQVAQRTPELDRLARLLPSAGDESVARPQLRAPRLSFNAAITRRRGMAFDRLATHDVLAVKQATEHSFNDVLVAVCAGALRAWLVDHDELPTSPTVALLPLLVQGPNGRRDAVAAGMIVPLATNVADPLERLERTHESLRQAKERHRAIPASAIADLSTFAPAAVAARASRLVQAMPYRSFIGPAVNVAITNVPGRRQPMFLAGCRLVSSHPLQPITTLTPLNIGLQSGEDTIGVGTVSCRDNMVDLDQLAAALPAALAELVAATGASHR